MVVVVVVVSGEWFAQRSWELNREREREKVNIGMDYRKL